MPKPEDKTAAKALAQQIGRDVARRRKELGLSQEKLAELVDCHRTYVGMVERGEKNIRLFTLKSFASALGCLPSDLLKKIGL